MCNKAVIRATAEALFAAFQVAGAQTIDADIMLPAESLLDLYGEDIRARAYVTNDPVLGEMMLRPDFTVPVVQAHMKQGARDARYTYMGEVFRKQGHIADRAREYLQVGYEVFGGAEPHQADAEVFALFSRLLAPLNLNATIGDIGILISAVQGLNTSNWRKAALMRHLWRPARFRDLLDQFSGRSPLSPSRQDLLQRLAQNDVQELIKQAGPDIGLRSAQDVAARAQSLQEDAELPPIGQAEAQMLEALLTLQGPAGQMLAHLQKMAQQFPAIAASVASFGARLSAMKVQGIDSDHLSFVVSHGRSTLEYYDGFVFSFDRPDQRFPAVASGGRYDALTLVLGQGRSIRAVGGVIRPAEMAALLEVGS
ncbi:MAG: ATP phosphoribosyltransferase regulatory subunit [Paracoccaceae bacterium]|jgi:ATP phosphoribosyltransferase regulatory subunit